MQSTSGKTGRRVGKYRSSRSQRPRVRLGIDPRALLCFLVSAEQFEYCAAANESATKQQMLSPWCLSFKHVAPPRPARVRDLDGIALVEAHKTKINTIAFSTRRRCMASGSADGYIVIWDLNGQKLHTIFLQVRAVKGCSAVVL